MQILFKVFWFPVLNSDKCSNHKFYDFLLFYCLILLRLLDTFPVLLPRPILCISPPCCVHLLCVSLACSLPAVYIHNFSPSLLYACLPSIRLPLPLRVLPASPPPPVRASILHLALLLLGTWAFFRQLLQAFMHTLLCLLVFPHALSSFFQPPLCISLIPAYLYPFLPSIFLIFWFLLSPYLRHPSLGLPFVPFLSNSLWSVLANWFYRKNVLLSFAEVRKPALQTIQHCVKSDGSQLNLQNSFFPHITALLGSFPWKAK